MVLTKSLSLARHYRTRFQILWPGFFYSSVISPLWPIAVGLQNLSKNRVSSPEVRSGSVGKAILLADKDAGATRGPDLDYAVADWMVNSLKIPEVVITSLPDGVVSETKGAQVVVMSGSFLWAFARANKPVQAVGRALQLARSLRRLRLTVWTLLPDTHVLPDSFFSNLFIWLCGGRAIVLQSTQSESDRWGNLSYSGPHFWTWTPSKLEEFASQLDFSRKRQSVLIALTGDSRRRQYMRVAKEALMSSEIDVKSSDYSMDWEEYVETVRTTRCVVTANWTQEWYLGGPESLSRRVSPTTTTGRVWEAFAACALLITNETEMLHQLGFRPGKHYLPLPNNPAELPKVLEQSWPGHSELAQRGHHHFARIAKRYK